MKNTVSLICYAIVAIALAMPAPAYAQGSVFVSGDGNDANSCGSPATACRSVSHAQTVVFDHGTINMLPGIYGAVTITKSVNLLAVQGNVTFAGSSSCPPSLGVCANVVISAAATDSVVIRGANFNFDSGVLFISGQSLNIEDCSLENRNATRYGIEIRNTANAQVTISNCQIANFNGTPAGDSGAIRVRPGNTIKANVVISNSRLTGGRYGVDAYTGATVSVRGSTLSGNSVGLRTAQVNATIRVVDSIITGNGTGLQHSAGSIISLGGNLVADNGTAGTFSSNADLQ